MTPTLRAKAAELFRLGAPVGTVYPFEAEGVRYEARIEIHTKYGADPKRPEKPHRSLGLYHLDAPLVMPAAARAAPPARGQGDALGVPFRQARGFTKGPREPREIRVVVVHTAECGETMAAAENLAAWCAGPDAPKASWHYAIDADSIVQSVLERDIAWHAPGANSYAIGLEHAGRAGQDCAAWDDEYSRLVLRRSALLVSGICRRHKIPIQQLSPNQLIAGERGICGHHDVSRAFKRSTHWDPGPAFPWLTYLAMIRSAEAIV